MQYLWLLFLSLFLSSVLSCSSTQSQKMHFRNKALTISPKQTWGVGILGDELIIGSRPKIAKDLSLNTSELEEVILESLNDSIPNYLQQYLKTNVVQLPALQKGALDQAQSVQLDKTSFIKVQWPLQGQEFSNNGQTPRYLFLIHDLYIGLNLNATDLYDYEKANIEQESTSSKTFSVVLSYTLWDNSLQQFIRYGAVDWRKEAFGGIHPKLIHQGVKSALAKAWEAQL